MLLQYLLEPDPTLLPALPHSVLTSPFDLSYLTPQGLQEGQENPMCQNKLYFQKPQVEATYRNLSLYACTSCQRNNAAMQRMQKLAVSAFSLCAEKLCCVLYVFNFMIQFVLLTFSLSKPTEQTLPAYMSLT